MKTLSAVYAYVGFFPSIPSLPPRLRRELPQKTSKKGNRPWLITNLLADSYRMQRPALRVKTTCIIQHTPERCSGQRGGCIRRYQERRPLLPSFLFMHFISLSLSCFADLSQCEPSRIGGLPWSTGRPDTHLYLPFCIVAAVPSHLAFFR
jgi:hypothetical protein